jgi:hypothetical protein
MKTKSRITSIVNSHSLSSSIAGISTFSLSQLDLDTDLEVTLPDNVRLGHLAEKVVSELIKSSTNYTLLYENIQILEGKKTIGEIDFILQEASTNEITHVELAYKFYLYDPAISSEPIKNWIGPNRNDSLQEKLDKLEKKQFPLLYNRYVKYKLEDIALADVSQALCLLVSLYIPYEYKKSFSPEYQKGIKGYYLDFETFTILEHSATFYYTPTKKEWGIDPSENEIWTELSGIQQQIKACMLEKQAPLVWQKKGSTYTQFFIVWW